MLTHYLYKRSTCNKTIHKGKPSRKGKKDSLVKTSDTDRLNKRTQYILSLATEE